MTGTAYLPALFVVNLHRFGSPILCLPSAHPPLAAMPAHLPAYYKRRGGDSARGLQRLRFSSAPPRAAAVRRAPPLRAAYGSSPTERARTRPTQPHAPAAHCAARVPGTWRTTAYTSLRALSLRRRMVTLVVRTEQTLVRDGDTTVATFMTVALWRQWRGHGHGLVAGRGGGRDGEAGGADRRREGVMERTTGDRAGHPTCPPTCRVPTSYTSSSPLASFLPSTSLSPPPPHPCPPLSPYPHLSRALSTSHLATSSLPALPPHPLYILPSSFTPHLPYLHTTLSIPLRGITARI